MRQRMLLANARRSKGWSQEETAGRVGVTRNTYLQWEHGVSVPYPTNMYRLCNVFEMSAEELGLIEHEKEEEMDLSRRQLLSASVGLVSLVAAGPTMIPMEEFLPQCSASLQACRSLMQGSELSLAGQILNTYVPTLLKQVLIPSQHQEAIAGLIAQAKMLQAVLAMHRLNYLDREMCCHEAANYSKVSGDPGLIAAAKMNLGHTYTYCIQRPEKAILAYLEGLRALTDQTSILRSHIYMGLASAYAQHKEEQKAFEAIELAKEHFPDHPELDPHRLYVDCDRSLIYQWEGKMYLGLARHYPQRKFAQHAYDAFAQSVQLGAVTERVISETLILSAHSAILLDDMQHYATCLHDGALRGLALGSQRRYNEAITVFKRTPIAWQKEPLIRALEEEIFHKQARRIIL